MKKIDRWITWVAWLMLLFVVADMARGQTMTPCDAVDAAAHDLAMLPPEVRAHQHYVWIPNWHEDFNSTGAIAFAMNCVSRTELLVSPTPILGGRLVRIDLLEMAPGAENYVAFRQLWESMIEQEPYFYAKPEFVKADEAKKLEQTLTTSVLGVEVPVAVVPTNVETGAFAKHITDYVPEAAKALVSMTGNTFPISRGDWLITKLLTADQGGKYYEFLGITPETTQDEYLLSRGYSVANSKEKYANERSALVTSKITGKLRWGEFIRSNATRLSASATAIGVITHDIFDEDVGPEFNIFRNLLEAKDRGREIIIERNNGYHEWSLWTAEGKPVPVAPQKIAVDHMIPDGHSDELVAGMSCIRCHGSHDGWQPFPNDVHLMMGTDGFDIFGDLRQPDHTEAIRRLAGMYKGDLTNALFLARMSYAQAVTKSTGMKVAAASAAVAQMHDSYMYEIVTPAKACLEGGIPILAEGSDITLIQALGRVIPEDPDIRLLQTVGINRHQFETVFTDFALRTMPYIQQQRKAEQAPDPKPEE